MLKNSDFKNVVTNTPLVSIDLIVTNADKKYLFGFRSNRPAKGMWFVPGGRIFKGETKSEAFTRLCHKEIGVALDIEDANFKGVFEHFYDDSVFGEGISTHYVVLAFEIEMDIELERLPEEQHSLYKWFSVGDLQDDDNVHVHAKWYFE